LTISGRGEEKWICRESQTKGKEAAVKWPNGSSEVKTGEGISNAVNSPVCLLLPLSLSIV